MIEIIADVETAGDTVVRRDGQRGRNAQSFAEASLTVTDVVLYFARCASPGTILNLKRNPAVEINVVDIFQRRGYRSMAVR